MIQQWLYNLMILSYRAGIGIASLFNQKARLWISGRRNWVKKLESETPLKSGKTVWIHAASLGEFEQGRPVIELIRSRFPEIRLVLTFFSPSGYEVRKDYDEVDVVSYLPLDTRKNAQIFLDIVDPDMVIFIKYEFWFNHLFELKNRSIPAILVSGRMHSKQGFFRLWGGFFKKGLNTFNHFFLQDENSGKLLSEIGFSNATVNGDTRFDRVLKVLEQNKEIPEVASFSGDAPVIMIGSSWPYEEILIQKFIKDYEGLDFKVVIAPHEIDEKRIDEFKEECALEVLKFSEWKSRKGQERVLIIDNIGMLSHLYKYATIAIIGGGFGNGIHNVLEAAVWSKPVVFGPRFTSFHEAVELVKQSAAFTVETQTELNTTILRLIENEQEREAAGNRALEYCMSNQGASSIVVDFIQAVLSE